MNINVIKDRISLFKGKTVNFRFNGSRNRIEEFTGTITDTYPEIFIVRLDANMIKSFSYSDVLIHKLIIKG